MTAIFDNMTVALSSIFGATATVHPASGPPVQVQGILRETFVEQEDGDGRPYTVPMVVFRVRKSLAGPVKKGSQITSPRYPHTTFRVLNVHHDRSPAAENFVVAELERV